MYSLVLMAAISTAPETPQFNGFFQDLFRGGCNGTCQGHDTSRDADRSGSGCHASCQGGFGSRIRDFFGMMGCRGSCSGTCHGNRDRDDSRVRDRGYATGCNGSCLGGGNAIAPGSCFGSGPVSYGGSCFGSGGGCFGTSAPMFDYGLPAPAGGVPGGFAQPRVADYGVYQSSAIGAGCNCQSHELASAMPNLGMSTAPFSNLGEPLPASGDYPTITPPNVPTRMPGIEVDRGSTDSSSSKLTMDNTNDTNRASVFVRLPVNGKLFVEGRTMEVTNGERTFVTPPLPTDRDAVYAFKAEYDRNGETISVTRSIRVRAGGLARVDFTELTVVAPSTLPTVPNADLKTVTGTIPSFNAKTTTKSHAQERTVKAVGGVERAKLTVHLPAGSTLYVNGVKNPRSGLTREFTTPELQIGTLYKYTMRAEVVRNGLPEFQEQTIEFRPGDSLTVDFRPDTAFHLMDGQRVSR